MMNLIVNLELLKLKKEEVQSIFNKKIQYKFSLYKIDLNVCNIKIKLNKNLDKII